MNLLHTIWNGIGLTLNNETATIEIKWQLVSVILFVKLLVDYIRYVRVPRKHYKKG